MQLNWSRPRPGSYLHALALAVLPTGTVLIVLAILELSSRQHLLFASLASSAFLVFLDAEHPVNDVRVLLGTQIPAALAGLATQRWLGFGYGAAAGAMVFTILWMITLRMTHPPAVSTALSFSFARNPLENLGWFAVAVAVVAALVLLQRPMVRWLQHRRSERAGR